MRGEAERRGEERQRGEERRGEERRGEERTGDGKYKTNKITPTRQIDPLFCCCSTLYSLNPQYSRP